MTDSEILALIDKLQQGGAATEEEDSSIYNQLDDSIPGLPDLMFYPPPDFQPTDAQSILDEARKRFRVFAAGANGVAITHPLKDT